MSQLMRHTLSTTTQYKVYGPGGQLRYSVTSGTELTVDDCFMLAKDHYMGAPAGSSMYLSDRAGCIRILSPAAYDDRLMTKQGLARLRQQRGEPR